MSTEYEIRELHGPAEFAACVQLQRETWGASFSETVPAAILQVSQKIGGITAGAFEDGQMVGFVFGMTGVDEAGAPVHWSDMLAVRSTHRNRGIGEKLKWYQRDTLRARGVERMYWTFDPLDAKNAYLNFTRLGVTAREYVVDMYGQTDSPLHATGTDRLIVVWEMASERVLARRAGQLDEQVRVDTRIEIPMDIHELNRASPKRAREWREKTRAEFLKYLPGNVVTAFLRTDERGYYALTSDSNFSA